MPEPRFAPRKLARLRALALVLPLAGLSVGCERARAPEDGASQHEKGAAEGEAAAPTVGTVAKIRGSRGVHSPDLPDGAFLGEGAAVHAGQWLELPRGTRVEIELGGGGRLRIDEDSRIRLPGGSVDEAPLTLERGRLIVFADGVGPEGGERSPLEVVAGDDRLTVERGEVELHNAGETRHYGVIQGRAILHTDGRDIALGAGASISTPAAPTTRPETPPDPTILAAAVPTLSLAPLHESAWAQSFEDTQTIVDNLPQGVGSLVARRAGSQVERQSLRITEQKVKVTISGRIARTEIEQAFHNDSGQTLEGIYQFPLPSDASISDLQLLVGDTWMRGEMLEKRRARQIFREIVDATVPRDPALLQWEQGGVFKLNIFPIPGRGERRIKIAYTQVLPAVGDNLRYRYPMGGSGATATEIGDFEFTVDVDGRGLGDEALGEVATPMAELSRTRDDGRLELAMRERDYQPTHELGVDIPLPEDARRVIASTHRDHDGQGYFMLTLRPDLELRADPRPVHYAFVLDRSHGTSPELWTAAEGMTKAMLATLEPDDRFTVLACDTACDRLSGGLRTVATADTLTAVDGFFDQQVLAGASDIGNMLEHAATAFADDGNTDAERVIVYLGDGVPTSGALTPDELGDIAQHALAHVRVQAVAMGARSDLLVLDNLVRESGGDLLQVDARDDLERVARELRLRAQVPVARDLQLELPAALTDVYPRSVPAMRPGDTLTLVGKLRDGDPAGLRGDVRLAGVGPSGRVDERFQVMLDAEYTRGREMGVHAHLPRTWAQAEITHLTQTEGAAARDRIVALSREYNVLSRWTALLVLENDRMYREFNVARRSGDKSGWDGELGGAGDAATDKEKKTEKPDATATTARPSDDPAPPPEAEPQPTSPSFPEFEGEEEKLEDSKDRDAESAAANQMGPIDTGDDGAFDALAPVDDASGFSDWDEDLDGGDVVGGESIGNAGGGKKMGGGGSSSGFAPAPKPESKPSKPKPNSAPGSASRTKSKGKVAWEDNWGGAPWEEQIWERPQQRPRQRMLLRDAGGPSSSDRQAIADLQRQRDADPSNRATHRSLVRRAARSGHANSRAFAAAWAEADPDHAPALLANADALAADGEPLALRAYASAVEVEPFSVRMHRRMAQAHTHAGDFERACSHRRALVSIDPSDGSDAAELVRCLARAGQFERARAAHTRAAQTVKSSAGKKALKQAAAVLDDRGGASTSRARLHGSPDLRAELRWSAAENLDIAFVDRRGRRLSVLRPEQVRVREQRDGAERVEIMTLREVQGTVFVEVTRPDSRREDTVSATLTVKTMTGRRTWHLRLAPGTQRVALTKWEHGSRRSFGGW